MSAKYPARFYAAVHDGNPGDVEFYRRRCASVRSIVELGCGDARVLAALAEPGRTLVGVDVDPGQLELAGARARACGATVELIEADMRAGDLVDRLGGRRFDRVIIPHGGIYCLLDEDALADALRSAAALLDERGLLLLDAWAADDFHREAEPEDQDPSWLERVKTIEVDGATWEVLERSTWDKPKQRLDVTYIHVRVGSEEAIEGLLEQRYVLADQLTGLLARVGLDLVELAGDFEGGPYDERSELMVVTARRK